MISLLVLGEGGLLGQAITRAALHDSRFRSVATPPVPWNDSARALEVIFDHLEGVVAQYSSDRWVIVWAAGATIPASSQAEVDVEVEFFNKFAHSLSRFAGFSQSPGALVYGSSAGAVYGAAPNPPFNEFTEPRPNSPYGFLKRHCETRVESITQPNLATATLRISNLYGPGQRLSKPQGLISHLLRSTILRDEMNIYVPLETTRDYIYVDDCASVVLDACAYVSRDELQGHFLKNVSANQVVSVASLIAMTRRVAKRAPNVVVGSSPLMNRQALDMRISSCVVPELNLNAPTSIEVGMNQLLIHMLREYQSGSLES